MYLKTSSGVNPFESQVNKHEFYLIDSKKVLSFQKRLVFVSTIWQLENPIRILHYAVQASDSETLWSQAPFTLLKTTDDPKVLLFIGSIYGYIPY